ncbi:hypothetical protein L1887_11526 [Cichorium endivia]|nr:hypothetical protein L1887_11526 [Cichorium endivia]
MFSKDRRGKKDKVGHVEQHDVGKRVNNSGIGGGIIDEDASRISRTTNNEEMEYGFDGLRCKSYEATVWQIPDLYSQSSSPRLERIIPLMHKFKD